MTISLTLILFLYINVGELSLLAQIRNIFHFRWSIYDRNKLSHKITRTETI